MRALSSVLTGLFANTEIYSNKAVVYVWKRPCFVSILHLDLNLKQEQFLQRLGAIYKWISLTLNCFIKRFWLDRTQLNDPIHIPAFFTRRCFPFSQKQKSKISMFSGATRVTDWVFFSPLLLGYQLEQNDTGKSFFKEKRDPLHCHFYNHTQKNVECCFYIFFYIQYKFFQLHSDKNICWKIHGKKRSTLYNPNQQMHLQPVLITSSTEIYIWPQPFCGHILKL